MERFRIICKRFGLLRIPPPRIHMKKGGQAYSDRDSVAIGSRLLCGDRPLLVRMVDHELAHYIQWWYTKRGFTLRFLSGLICSFVSTILAQKSVNRYKAYTEGFAEWLTSKMGDVPSRLVVRAESSFDSSGRLSFALKGLNSYVLGRRAYVFIESCYGEEEALRIALSENTESFVDKYYSSCLRSSVIPIRMR